MSLASYSQYVDSGDPLIGSVPAHWSRSALKRLATYQNGFAFKPEDWATEGLPIIRIAQLTSDAEPNFFAGKLDEKLFVVTGDLLFSWSATIDSFIWRSGDAWVNQHIFKVSPTEEATKSYLFYLIKFLAPKLADLDAHGSTMRHIKKESLGQLVYVPSLGEQAAIATFLDHETAKIDALIAEQEKLIALLAEKRQATISHAVTKGLNPDVPMKDSGVVWLGEVPRHWGVKALGKITVSKCDGPFGSGLKSEHYVDEGVRVIRLQNIRVGYFDGCDEAFIDLNYFQSEMSRHNVQENDILIAGLGDENNIVGRACVAPAGIYPAMVKADCFRFRLDTSQAFPAYIAQALSVGSTFDAGIYSTGTTRSRIPLLVTASRKIPLPPLEEQSAIAEYLEEQIAKFNALRDEAQRAITLLKERRSALITAAVTGQIDVRNLVQEVLA